MIAVGAAEWVVANVSSQIEIIADHVRHPRGPPSSPSPAERALIDQASATVRKARQAVAVAFGRRQQSSP